MKPPLAPSGPLWPPLCGPQDMPKIMRPGRKWSSPTARSCMHATSAWKWLLAYWTEGHAGKISPKAAWRSKLLPFLSIARNQTCLEQPHLVISVAQYGAICWPLERGSYAENWRLEMKQCPLKWVHVVELLGWELLAYRALS